MTPRARRLAALASWVALFGLWSGCAVTGLNFRQDDRVEIVSPADRAEVTLPLKVAWTVDDFRVTGRDGRSRPDAGFFGVFVDRTPQPPGDPPGSLVEDTASCRLDPECPSEKYLERQNIFTTTETSFTVTRVPEPENPDRRTFHTVTVVLLDGRGERLGESAFAVRFEVRGA